MTQAQPIDYAARLRHLRGARGLSQVQLAAWLGVSRASLQRWEGGTTRPSALAWERITRLEAGAGDGARAKRVALPEPSRLPSGLGALPVALSSFVGRERERTAVADLLRRSRLVTLTGAGGTGKTRLAVQVAADLAPRYGDGVRFVDLSGLADLALVLPSVAAALGVGEQRDQPLSERLVAALAPCELLLVLDNCEHLLGACAALALLLLRGCPTLRLLATSRQPLAVEGEMIWRVPPLALAPEAGPFTPATLAGSEAVQLFSERARAVEPAFTVTAANAAALAALCRRLDGLPLALELAAARVSVLAVAQILARLDDRFRLLTGGRRGAPARHQTLQAAIAWSYDLLSAAPRALFDRLAVFAGSFSLEAAEAIDRASSAPGEPVLDLLTALIDKSLLVKEEAHGEARYRLLETLRAYGRERLLASGAAQGALRRHAEFYGALVREATEHLEGPQQGVWLTRLDQELDNLRAALAWSTDRAGDAELGLRLAGQLVKYWERRGRLSEGRTWAERALARAKGATPIARAVALHCAGFLAYRQGHATAARSYLEECLAIYRELGRTPAEATVLNALGLVAGEQGDNATASMLLEQSAALYEAAGDRANGAHVLNNLALLALVARDWDRAAALLAESNARLREAGNERGVAVTLANAALAELGRGNSDRATALAAESLALCQRLGDVWGISQALGSAAGAAALRAGIRIGRRSPAPILGAATGAAPRGRLAERAVQLCAALDALRRQAQLGRSGPYQGYLDTLDAALRAQLGEECYATAWAEGSRLAPDEAVELALAPDEEPVPGLQPAEAAPTAARGRRQGTTAVSDTLTAREQEILRLLAGGSSTKEIATRLVVSARTVEHHLTSIYAKIGARGKADAVAYAVRQGVA